MNQTAQSLGDNMNDLKSEISVFKTEKNILYENVFIVSYILFMIIECSWSTNSIIYVTGDIFHS